MKIYKYTPGKRLALTKSLVALGLFDGVHRGHRVLLDEARRLADEHALPFCVFTFSDKDGFLKKGARLFTDDERASILKECGVEHLIVADFSEMAATEAEDFIKNALARDLDAQITVAGTDFRFGKGRKGDTGLLDCEMQGLGRKFVAIEPIKENGTKISTAAIKELVSNGDVSRARQLLGSPYFIESRVERGMGLGTKLGIPTVNISLQDGKISPKRGVYAAAVKVGEKVYTALTNIGTCPSFGEREAHTETFILNFSGSLYGEIIRVYLLQHLRDEKKFSSAKELTEQIKFDTDTTTKLTEALKWQEIGIN